MSQRVEKNVKSEFSLTFKTKARTGFKVPSVRLSGERDKKKQAMKAMKAMKAENEFKYEFNFKNKSPGFKVQS